MRVTPPTSPDAPLTPSPVSVADIRAWLRMGSDQDDEIIAALAAAATALCESYIGQYLMIRSVEEDVTATTGRLRLSKKPVQEISSVRPLAAPSPATAPQANAPLDTAQWSPLIHANGIGEVTLHRAATQSLRGASPRYRVDYRVGMASRAEDIPEALRQGIIRMVAYLHQSRDSNSDSTPPMVVTLLWQPWRSLGLGTASAGHGRVVTTESLSTDAESQSQPQEQGQ